MIRRLFRKKLDAVDRELGQNTTGYLRHILRVSLRSFLKFAKVIPLSGHRRALSAGFSEAVVSASGDEDPIRERIRARHDEEALVEMALAIAVCRVFPVTKRALGHATSCSRVKIRV